MLLLWLPSVGEGPGVENVELRLVGEGPGVPCAEPGVDLGRRILSGPGSGPVDDEAAGKEAARWSDWCLRGSPVPLGCGAGWVLILGTPCGLAFVRLPVVSGGPSCLLGPLPGLLILVDTP